ncbi:MAG TPA: hypothetical protein VJK25_00060, partial [Patescibacteria group bacterium]|nr:hypothetical protein [Patescibacteria group bacterium]
MEVLGEEYSTERKVKAIEEKAKKKWYDVFYRAYNVAWRNALRTFLSRMAYNAATVIAEGDYGKKPLFWQTNFSDFLGDVAETTLVDTLDFLASENGFFKFDICEPQDLDLRFAIHYSLFREGKPRGAPKCTLSQLATSWTDWANKAGSAFKDSDTFLSKFRDAFKPEQTDAGIWLTLDDSIRSRMQSEENKKALDRLATQGLKDVTEPITGFIKTPATYLGFEQQAVLGSQAVSETTRTGDIVADAIGIFTNTLASKWLKTLFENGLNEGQKLQTIIDYNWANQQARPPANEQFAKLAEVRYSKGEENILPEITKCARPDNPDPLDCVLSGLLTTAIEQNLTVAQALDRNPSLANWPVGYYQNGQEPPYSEGFPYRSLVILRTLRIIPVGWELAAEYYKNYGSNNRDKLTLGYLLDCYQDDSAPQDDSALQDDSAPNNPRKPDSCREDMNGNNSANDQADYNPYYHLVDPNWVLKLPQSYCAKSGPGPIIATELMEVLDPETGEPMLDDQDQPIFEVLYERQDDYCAARKSCLFEDDQG